MTYPYSPSVEASRVRRGGPAAGALAAVAVLGVSVLVRGPVMNEGLLSSFADLNDSSIAGLMDAAVIVAVLAAAVGSWAGVDGRDRNAGIVSSRTGVGMLVGALVPAVFGPVGVAWFLAQGPHTVNVALILLVLEVAVAAGAGLGVATWRWEAVRGVIVATLTSLWLGVTLRGVLLHVIPPETFYGPDGTVSAAASRAIRILAVWDPIVVGLAAAVGGILGGFLVPRASNRVRWLAATTAAPLLASMLGAGLGTLAVGSQAMTNMPTYWAHIAGGCLIAFGLAVTVLWRRRTAQPAPLRDRT